MNRKAVCNSGRNSATDVNYIFEASSKMGLEDNEENMDTEEGAPRPTDQDSDIEFLGYFIRGFASSPQ